MMNYGHRSSQPRRIHRIGRMVLLVRLIVCNMHNYTIIIIIFMNGIRSRNITTM